MLILLVSVVMEDSDTVSCNSKTFEEETSIEREEMLDVQILKHYYDLIYYNTGVYFLMSCNY